MASLYTNSGQYTSAYPAFRLLKVDATLPILDGMGHPGFSERLREACRDAKAPDTMDALGRYLGVSKSMAWNYWAGEKLPSMEKAIEIASKLGVCVEWLLTGRGSKMPSKPPEEVIDISDLPPETRAGLRVLIESMKSADKNQRAA